MFPSFQHCRFSYTQPSNLGTHFRLKRKSHCIRPVLQELRGHAPRGRWDSKCWTSHSTHTCCFRRAVPAGIPEGSSTGQHWVTRKHEGADLPHWCTSHSSAPLGYTLHMIWHWLSDTYFYLSRQRNNRPM